MTTTPPDVRALDPDIDVPDGVAPAATCPYCDRPFDGEHARDLHVGERHGDEATDAERTDYEAALEAERDELWMFHMKVIVALGSIYAVTVIAYMVAIQSGAV